MKTYITEELPKLSAQLRAGARKDFRKRRTDARDLNAALWSAAAYAREGSTMYVYAGNSYGHAVYCVTYRRSDADCFVNNPDGRWYEIDTALTATLCEVTR